MLIVHMYLFLGKQRQNQQVSLKIERRALIQSRDCPNWLNFQVSVN